MVVAVPRLTWNDPASLAAGTGIGTVRHPLWVESYSPVASAAVYSCMAPHRSTFSHASHSLRLAGFAAAYALAMALGTALLIAGLN
jgi:hypothetical protein